MDLERLKTIIDWMSASPLSEVEIEDGEFRVHLVRGPDGQVVGPTFVSLAGQDVLAASYGVVHLAPDPASAPFVSVGQAVEAGQSLCIIEAMKVFNPVEAERPGVIAAILVADGAEVAAGQPLFRLE
jgi:acetyl-CoA carboxylase biotin carboxyl carrier protein